MTHARRLRELLAGKPFIAPGCYDAFTALLIEQAGFSCAYVSGASVSFTRLGRPDIGLTTLTEVAETVGNIRDRIGLPLIVDGDNGFGNALNVQRTVRLLEKMGASAIQLEDQTMPKRCGHLAGKTLVTTGEMVGKLKAAQDARHETDTVIVARTDAITVEGFEAGLARAHAYAAAGADVLFVEALTDQEQLARVGRELGGRLPLLANMVEGGKTPLLTIAELGALGFRLAIFPGAMVRVIGHAASNYLATLRVEGTTRTMLDRMLDFSGLNAVIGTDELLRHGEGYAPRADSRKPGA
ncbi:MAG: oxaloacetate decarboxylase [Gammaproteobacteria bacterium PRO9]|nr:oxaloacetate decarboxylase [Gammaproteobacteria bacterium PRO9]